MRRGSLTDHGTGARHPARRLREQGDVVPPRIISDAGPGPAIGTYLGTVISDTEGNSRRDVAPTLVKLGRSTVRESSDHRRPWRAVEATLTQAGDGTPRADGDRPLIVDLGQATEAAFRTTWRSRAWRKPTRTLLLAGAFDRLSAPVPQSSAKPFTTRRAPSPCNVRLPGASA